MKNFLFYILFIFLTGSSLFAQNKKQSSKNYHRSKKQKISSQYYLKKAYSIFEKSPTQAIEYVQDALAISIREKNEQEQGKAYELLGKINYSLKQWTLATENYQQAFVHYQKNKSSTPKAYQLYKKMGMCYEQEKQYNKALQHYLLYKKHHPSQQIETDKSIANVYFLLGENQEALEIYEQVLKQEEEAKDFLGSSETKAHIANIYLAMKNPQQAKNYYEASENLNTQAIDEQQQGKRSYSSQQVKNSTQSLDNTQNSLGKMYRDNRLYDDEISLRERAIQRGKRDNNPKKVSQEEIEISNIYLEQGLNTKAIEQLKNTISKVDTIDNTKEEKAIAYKTLSKVYNEEKEYEKALIAYQNYVIEQEKILKEKEENHTHLSEALTLQKELVTIQKDFKIQEQTIDFLKKEKELQQANLQNQRWLIYGLLLIIFITLTATFFIYKNAKERRIANQLLALKSLRSQMNPHFIFNALNSVNQFIAKNDERTANQFLSDFSRLMRLVLENSQKDFVSLSKEINIIQLYIKLEHNRFRDQFDYTLEIDENIDIDNIEIPPMLIQPYIENAVWHGLRYKEEFGHLKIKLTYIENKIHIVIEDDGIGRKNSQLLKTKHQQNSKSTGLKNTKNRISIINNVYQKDFVLTIEDLQLNGTGTRVELKFPCIYN